MKAGFAVLVGRSNVGKSTLLNALVGTKIAITSPKPQTTRHQIQGVVHDPRGQIVFVDTPGVFEKTHDRLTRELNTTAKSALQGIEVIVYVADPTRPIGNEEHILLRMVSGKSAPKILVINKMDERNPPFVSEYRDLAPRFDEVMEISALRGRGIKSLISAILDRLPEGEPYYPEYQITPMDNTFWIGELIREKVFIQMGAEIPYSTTVEVIDVHTKSDAKPPLLVITAQILTWNPRHKAMLIGAGGHKIKEIGHAARKELEAVFNTKVYLDLSVSVDADWPDRLSSRDDV